MRAWVGKGLAWAAGLGLAATAHDARIAPWLYLLQENPPALRAEAWLALAARRNGLAPPADRTAQRRQLLAWVFPHLLFPDSAVEQMTLAEEFVFSQCSEEREAGQGKAWDRYHALANEIPDSLLPSWEWMEPFLQAGEMQAMPACRAKLLVASSPGAFRENCSDPPASERC